MKIKPGETQIIHFAPGIAKFEVLKRIKATPGASFRWEIPKECLHKPLKFILQNKLTLKHIEEIRIYVEDRIIYSCDGKGLFYRGLFEWNDQPKKISKVKIMTISIFPARPLGGFTLNKEKKFEIRIKIKSRAPKNGTLKMIKEKK